MKKSGSEDFWAQTRYTLLGRIAHRVGTKRQIEDDQNALVEGYRRPAIAFLRMSGLSEHDAEDLVQELFMQLFAPDYLKEVLKGSDKFRSVVCTVLKRRRVDDWRKINAQKRGSGKVDTMATSEVETLVNEAGHDAGSPDRLFDKLLAKEHIEQLRRELRGRMAEQGKAVEFDLIFPKIGGHPNDVGSYPKLAAELGMTVDQVKGRVDVLRNLMNKGLRERLRRFVADPSQVDEELRDLLRALE